MSDKWKNRIVGSGEESPDQLLANPANWRVHPKYQQEALEGILSDVGWVQQIIVNKRTGNLIDGHLRVQLSMRNNEKAVPVIYVDLSEMEEKQILASLDPIAAMADRDNNLLHKLLEELVENDKSIYGFSDDDLALMELANFSDDLSLKSTRSTTEGEDMITLSFMVEPSYKDVIISKLNKVKESNDDINLGEALYILCKGE